MVRWLRSLRLLVLAHAYLRHADTVEISVGALVKIGAALAHGRVDLLLQVRHHRRLVGCGAGVVDSGRYLEFPLRAGGLVDLRISHGVLRQAVLEAHTNCQPAACEGSSAGAKPRRHFKLVRIVILLLLLHQLPRVFRNRLEAHATRGLVPADNLVVLLNG